MSAPMVLIVEDDPDTREMLGKFLELEGFQVDTAANGQLALEKLQAGANVGVIVLDLMMPVMDGWEFRKRQLADERLSRIPTIVVSAAGRDRMAQVTADAYLAKPIDMDELLSRVAEFCKG